MPTTIRYYTSDILLHRIKKQKKTHTKHTDMANRQTNRQTGIQTYTQGSSNLDLP